MVMRWKLLELAQEATSLESLVTSITQNEHFDVNREEALALLCQYIEILPDKVRQQLEDDGE